MATDLRMLAAQAAKGNQRAFRAIVKHSQARLFRLTARMMGNTTEAEDVLQEAYLSAHRALTRGQFDHRSNVQTWLYRIASNAAIDALRRRKAAPTVDEPAVDTRSVEPDGEARVALRELDRLLEQLSPEQRAVVILRSVEGHTTNETAEILECSAGAVEQRLIRARAVLKKKRSQITDVS